MNRRATFGGSVRKRLSGQFRASEGKDEGATKGKDSTASRPRSVSRLNKPAKSKGDQGTLKDPRNLSNKGTQKEMIDDILCFLQVNGYPHQISQKILQAPTSKDFFKVFEFLYSFIDKNDKIGPKWEEEVPRLLKQLKYPFPIAKSAMFTVGSLHTWPTLLGALHWLVNVIELIRGVDVDSILFSPYDENDSLSGCDQILHQYYEKTYKDFMNGCPDPEDDIWLREAILEKTGASVDDTEALAEEVEILRKRLAVLEAEPDRLKEMQDKIALWKANCEKIERGQEDLEQRRKMLQIDAKKVDEELKRYDYRRVKKIEADKNIEHQKEALDNRLKAIEQENDRLQAACWEREIGYSKLYNKVDQTLKEYDDLWRNVKREQLAMKYLQGVDVGLKIEHVEGGLKNTTKFRDTIKETLIKAQNRVMADMNEVESQRITEEEKMEKLMDLIKEKKYELEALKTNVVSVENEVEEAQKKADMDQKQADDELICLRDEMKVLEQGSDALVERKQKELTEQKELMEKERKEMEIKSQEIAQFLQNVVSTAKLHTEKLQSGFNKVVQIQDKDLEELEKRKKLSEIY